MVSNLGVAHSCMTVPDAAPVLDTSFPVRGFEVQGSEGQSRRPFNHCGCEDISTVAKVVEAGCLPTKGPSWGYPSPVLGAVAPFLSIFGENRPRFLKQMSKLTFEYPHEGPCVVCNLLSFCPRVHTVEFAGFVRSDFRALRDQICTT